MKPSPVSRVCRDNGLSIVLASLFLGMFVAQSLAGLVEYNREQLEHGDREVSYVSYLGGSHFWNATLENWESEFLQMFAFVILTAYLFQKGSAESKDPDDEEAVDADPRHIEASADAPLPVHRGGWMLYLYERSLGLAFLILFLASLALHARSSVALYNEEQLEHDGFTRSFVEHIQSADFWFESFQNWQSEFLSVWAMVVFTIFLRYRGSPESKPVHAPHGRTGG